MAVEEDLGLLLELELGFECLAVTVDENLGIQLELGLGLGGTWVKCCLKSMLTCLLAWKLDHYQKSH